MKDHAYNHSRNPLTKEIIRTVPIHSVTYLNERIKNARIVQKTWGELPVSQRVKQMKPGLKWIANNFQKMASTISEDNGKTYMDALSTEILPAAMALHYYLRKAPRFLRPESCGTGSWILFNKRSKLIRHPYGVVGIISPWNYPFSIAFSEVVMALLSGNAVILKTASETQAVTAILEETINRMDLPDGLFSSINMPGKIAGDALLESGIDKLFFTGSVPVGKYLMKKAADTLTPVNLELGGNDAMIVREDANLERAVNGAIWAGLQNAGQSCGGVERIYVHESVYDHFLELLRQKITLLPTGNPASSNVQIGCITTPRQAKLIREHIEEALTKGAQIWATGPLQEEHELLIPPTVLINVNHSMKVMRDETFGPVLGVMKFNCDEEAIALANDSDLGLTASIWSGNRKLAHRMAQRIDAGVITINDHLMSHGLPETSWGGFKQSGIGRSHGKLGFYEMTQSQFIIDDWFSALPRNIWWHPHSKHTQNALEGLMNLLYISHPGLKLKAVYHLIRYLPKLFSKSGVNESR